MKKITIENTTYKIPTSYQDITLGDYESWFDFEATNSYERIKLVSLITKIPYDVLMELPTSVFSYLASEVSFPFSKGFDYFEKLNEIVVDGISYSIGYKDEITLAEWVDVEAVLQQDENRLSEILAIVLRPIGEKYNSKNNPLRIALFRDITLDKAFPLFAFFLTLNHQYQKIIQLYSKVVEMANLQVEQCETYQKNGDGITQLSYWQKKIYQRLMKRLKKQLSKCSTSYHI